MEGLASGACSIQDVASRLAMTPRTLQRHELSLHYLQNTQLSDLDIAFLLGYKEAHSFVRAFQAWTGKRPNTFRLNRVQVGSPCPVRHSLARYTL